MGLRRIAATVLLLGVASTAAYAAAPSKTIPAVDPALCQELVKHTPSADVAYQPGVDVYGHKVAPADLPGSGGTIDIPHTIRIPLTVNLAKAINLDTTTYPGSVLGSGTETTLGTLTVEDGQVSFNGQPLSGVDQDNLAVICMKQTSGKP